MAHKRSVRLGQPVYEARSAKRPATTKGLRYAMSFRMRWRPASRCMDA